MATRRGRVETLQHKESKDSNIKWFIIAIIPLVNLYFIWKVAESLSGHEKSGRGTLNHQEPKGSTAKWFLAYLVAGALSGIGALSVMPAILGGVYGGAGGALVGVGVGVVLWFLGIVIELYLFWKVSELIAGHEEVYDRYSRMSHPERGGSTLKWMAIWILGLLLSFVFIGVIILIYYLWKVAWITSGHEVAYASRESGGSRAERKKHSPEPTKKCPNCGASISQRADFCPECGIELGQKEDKIVFTSECPNCGADVPKGANFCSDCGTQLEDEQT